MSIWECGGCAADPWHIAQPGVIEYSSMKIKYQGRKQSELQNADSCGVLQPFQWPPHSMWSQPSSQLLHRCSRPAPALGGWMKIQISLHTYILITIHFQSIHIKYSRPFFINISIFIHFLLSFTSCK